MFLSERSSAYRSGTCCRSAVDFATFYHLAPRLHAPKIHPRRQTARFDIVQPKREPFFPHQSPRHIIQPENRAVQVCAQSHRQPLPERVGSHLHLRLQRRVVLRRHAEVKRLAVRVGTILIAHCEADLIDIRLRELVQGVTLAAAR